MARPNPWWVVGPGLAGVAAVLAAAAAGLLGPLVTCGADGAAVCVAWPAPAAAAVWLLFLGVIAGLAAWQVGEWRREPRPSVGESRSEPPAR